MKTLGDIVLFLLGLVAIGFLVLGALILLFRIPTEYSGYVIFVLIAIGTVLGIRWAPEPNWGTSDGWSSHRGPRGGEYRMSKSGKSKVYITRS